MAVCGIQFCIEHNHAKQATYFRLLTQQLPLNILIIYLLIYLIILNKCIPAHNMSIIFKFADDTTVVGLITKGDEPLCKGTEGERLVAENNLAL